MQQRQRAAREVVEQIEIGGKLDERAAHLLGLSAQFGGFARGAEPVVPACERFRVFIRNSSEQTPGDSRLAGCDDEFEQVADPGLRRDGVAHDAVLDDAFETLRIAEGADGQRRARELEQADQRQRVVARAPRARPRIHVSPAGGTAKSWITPRRTASLVCW